MFVDVAKVTVKAGDGGNGIVSFRHEKFIDRGGPDGGDGGDGGDIVFVASWNQNTLATFRYHKEIKGQSGQPGGKRKMHGASGETLSVAVPVGTVISDNEGNELADLFEDGAQAVIAKGGKGGFGNAHFTSSTRQAPKVAEKGEKGERLELTLELKMIADVGLVGLPNAGKSTLLSVISNARPEIANYPFTTIRPNLGVVDIGKSDSLLVADIPGLIEGASEGKGLGDEFLRHIERTRVLVHMIDAYIDDIVKAYKTVQSELKHYKVDLSHLPQVVVLNKVDGLDQEIIDDLLGSLKKAVPKNTPIHAISAKSQTGIKELLFVVKKLSDASAKAAAKAAAAKKTIITLDDEDGWTVALEDDIFRVSGKKIERFAERTDFSNYHAVERLRDIMRKMGILHELERQNVASGRAVQIGENPAQRIEY